MVLETKLAYLKNMKISRVVMVSGMLTFLYIIEFAVGIRTVYFAFDRWSSSSKHTQATSLGLCLSSLFLFVASSFFINVISALWEQRQMKEGGQDKSVLRFTLHAIVGGMIWRYVCLWFCSSKELQRKEAALLTMVKFLFTQMCTIPMVIVHVSLLESLDEIIYDVTSVLGVSVNLILTCVVFSWCNKEILDLKKWNFETVDLVPLIFCESADAAGNTAVTENSDSISKDTEKGKGDATQEDEDTLETMILGIIVFLQIFSFSLGRLLALGILLKIAGIYSVSIMFLQLLISVVYLKFQVPSLVSDSLPKWRQLTRFVFMSYILIFEWQLNRNPKTGYDFTSNVKHSMAYYFIATVESIFYYVTWVIAYNYSSNSAFESVNSPTSKFMGNIIVIGSLCLLFSLAAHIMLMFWQSRSISSLMHSVRRRYLSSKLKFSSYGRKDTMKDDTSSENRPKLDISNPIPKDNEDPVWKQGNLDNDGQLTHHNSYKNLREPVDDEIEIYVRKFRSEDELNLNEREEENVQKASNPATGNYLRFPEQQYFNLESNRVNAFNTRGTLAAKSSENDKNAKQSKYPEDVLETESKKSNEVKSKVSIISETVNEKWNKFSSISKGFTSTMRDHIKKRKERVLNFRSPTTAENSDSGERSKENIQKQGKKFKFNLAAKDNTSDQHRKENHGNLVSDNNVPKRKEPFQNLSSNVAVKGKPQIKENHGSSVSNDDQTMNPRNRIRQDVEIVPKDHKAPTGFIVGEFHYAEKVVESSEQMEKTSVTDTQADDIAADGYSPVKNLNEKEIESCNNEEQDSCFDCDDGVEHQFLRRRSLSAPLPNRKLRQTFLKTMVATDASEDSTITHCSSRQETSSVEVEFENSSTSENYIPPMVAVHSGLKRLSLLPMDDRKEHFV